MIQSLISLISVLFGLSVPVNAVEYTVQAARKFGIPTGLLFSVCLGESGCGARGRILYGAQIFTNGQIETDYFEQAMAGARVLWRLRPRHPRSFVGWERALRAYRGLQSGPYAPSAILRWRRLCAASYGDLCTKTL